MSTLKSMKLHIGIFGKTNVGKSSLVNIIAQQEVSIVSELPGTTTDVVEKSMEFPSIGAVTFLDTAGVDDMSELGRERIERSFKVIFRADIAIIVCDYLGICDYEKILISKFKELNIPYCIVINKSDIQMPSKSVIKEIESISENYIVTSTFNDGSIFDKFKKLLIKILPENFDTSPKVVGDLLVEKSIVIMVVPIDKEAPKGRIILPQVQTLRDLLDKNCITMVVKETELQEALNSLNTLPSLVITDSQVFKKIEEIIPKDVPLTSFSILFARLKGDLGTFIEGAKSINRLQDGDKVLILESCTHHAIEDDIGKVKIPNLLLQKTGKNLVIDNFSGHDFPDISGYKLVIHCGACMTNRREMLSRIMIAEKSNIPITNYGIVIAYCLGILDRAIKFLMRT